VAAWAGAEWRGGRRRGMEWRRGRRIGLEGQARRSSESPARSFGATPEVIGKLIKGT